MHYTDKLPPEALLSDYPNWKYDEGKEGQAGCHEGTLWCCRRQNEITEDVGFSAGDVYFPDGSSSPALIGISDSLDFADELRVYADDRFWRIELVGRKSIEGTPGLWKPTVYRGDLRISMDDPSIFPLQYHTHLLSSESGRPISGCVTPGGGYTDWDPNEAWG